MRYIIINKKLLYKVLIISLFSFGAGLWADRSVFAEEYKVRKSTLDAAERQLAQATDPSERFTLLLRWIKIKETYEQDLLKRNSAQADKDLFKKSKQEILDRIEREITNFEKKPGVNLNILYREKGFRELEIQHWKRAADAFSKVTNRTPDDDLAYGDALIGDKVIDAALDTYARAGREPRLRNIAAYKRAWAYMQMNDFKSSLAEFDIALSDNPAATVRLKEEAYKDRLKPYIETYSKSSFDGTEAIQLKVLTRKVYTVSETLTEKDAEKAQKKLYVEALQKLIEGFNAKADIQKAQEVFAYLTHEMDDTTEVLIAAAPLWLKVYRGNLDHASVTRVLNTLPDKPLNIDKARGLQAELSNTAGFYETLADEEKNANRGETKAKSVLLLTYKKYFVLFASDPEADPLRVNYARMLLQDNEPEACLNILAPRTKHDAKVEEVASNLEARCEFKTLDQMYSKKHTDVFYAKLNKALLVDKIYKRSDLGVTSDQAFTSLAQMLVGALKKNAHSEMLRKSLRELIATYPFSKDQKQYKDLQLVSAELDFEDVVADKRPPEEKSESFYQIFLKAPVESEVAHKAIQNSILTSEKKESLDRCDQFQKTYPADFKPKEKIFDRCVRLAEQNLDLEKEYLYWSSVDKDLDKAQTIKVGLLELALNIAKGRARLKALKSEDGQFTLDTWDGVSAAKPVAVDKKWALIQADINYFLTRLKPISFGSIAKAVPKRIESFDAVDGELVRYYKSNPQPIFRAKALEQRALVTSRMRDWMKGLPDPVGFTEDELKQYHAKTAKVIEPWEAKAAQTSKQCSEAAYVLTTDFKQSADSVCPEKTADEIFTSAISKWEATRQDPKKPYAWDDKTEPQSHKTLRLLVDAGSKSQDPLKAKYFYLRAYDLATDARDKAKIMLALAKLTDKERFWLATASLDGNIPEPIQRLRLIADGNPFYSRLYDTELDLIKQNAKYDPAKAIKAAEVKEKSPKN